MKLSVVIPVYNERQSVAEVISRVRQSLQGRELEIIAVDDGSDDGTREVLSGLADEGLKVILKERNEGKGSALRAGFAAATGEIIIIQDADHEYDPREIPELLQPILDGYADVVYGSRLSGGRPQRVYMFWHMVGNRFLSFMANLLYNTTLSDMETGYKVFKRSCLDGMRLRSNGFDIEPELTAKFTKRGFRVYELPISYYGRTREEGKKISWVHGFQALWTIIRYRIAD